MAKKIHDISYTIKKSSIVWPGDTPISIERTCEIGKAESHATMSKFILSSHAGTHVDAPKHFVADGESLENLALDKLIGRVLVIELDEDEISKEVLEKLNIKEDTKRIIFKTKNSKRFSGEEEFFTDYVSVTISGAKWLVKRGIKLVGSDYLSVASYEDIAEVHRILLASNMVLLETLFLKNIKPGYYDLVCLPLKIEGADGSPARAVLIEN